MTIDKFKRRGNVRRCGGVRGGDTVESAVEEGNTSGNIDQMLKKTTGDGRLVELV